MKKNRAVETTAYRSLKDVYQVLREVSPLVALSERLGITRQGLRHKCNGPQFFTPAERDKAITALEELRDVIESCREAVSNLPTRVA